MGLPASSGRRVSVRIPGFTHSICTNDNNIIYINEEIHDLYVRLHGSLRRADKRSTHNPDRAIAS
jgi:hypothetical protein